jgi:hypothetical protein
VIACGSRWAGSARCRRWPARPAIRATSPRRSGAARARLAGGRLLAGRRHEHSRAGVRQSGAAVHQQRRLGYNERLRLRRHRLRAERKFLRSAAAGVRRRAVPQGRQSDGTRPADRIGRRQRGQSGRSLRATGSRPARARVRHLRADGAHGDAHRGLEDRARATASGDPRCRGLGAPARRTAPAAVARAAVACCRSMPRRSISGAYCSQTGRWVQRRTCTTGRSST